MLKDAIHLSSGTLLSQEVVAALWKRVLPDLAWDGSLRDVYVQNTTLADWRSFLDSLQREGYMVEYRFGNQKAPLPRVENLFQNRKDSHLLTIRLAGIQINCHFFTVEEIEMDLNPQEIREEIAFKLFLEFLTKMSKSLNRAVLLTHENREESAFLIVYPAD